MTTGNNPVLRLLSFLDDVRRELSQLVKIVSQAGDISLGLAEQGVRVSSFVLAENRLHVGVQQEMILPERVLPISPFAVIRDMLKTGQATIAGVDNKADYVNNSWGMDFEFEYPNAAPKKTVESQLAHLGITGLHSTMSEYYSNAGDHVVWFDVAI